MIRRVTKLCHFFRFVFHFRKPRFNKLEVIDLVISQVPLLLISWECDYSYSLHVRGTGFYSANKSAAYVVKLPSSLDHIFITISSGWRKTILETPLTRVSIAPEVLGQLIKNARGMQAPTVHSFDAFVPVRPVISMPAPLLFLPKTFTKFPNILVDPFDYHQHQLLL